MTVIALEYMKWKEENNPEWDNATGQSQVYSSWCGVECVGEWKD